MALAARLSRVPVSKVELFISCQKLLDKDTTSKSDPCAVVLTDVGGSWIELGRTENIKNCLDPKFAKAFEMDYFFEEVQKLKFAVYDLDNATPQLTDDDFLGSIECTLGQLVSSCPYTKPLLLKSGKKAGHGTITVRVQEMSQLNDILNVTFTARGLDKKDLLGKSDPYLEFSRQMPDGSYQVVHRTEVVKNNLNPRWKPFQIKAQKLCGGNYDAPIKVECYDYDSDGSHDLIGNFSITIKEMMSAVDTEKSWLCINPKKKSKKKSYKDSGTVILNSCQITKQFSFLEFIFGGMDIHFTVAVDFTASNGDPRNPQSLHYLNPYEPNEYMTAIQSVGAVIQDYDSDQMFPALGFGAKIPPKMTVSHEFALNFNPGNPFCTGIHGVLEAYKTCLPQIQLYGPTNFSPIIYHVAQFAAAATKENAAKNYFVLLIITDGVITDMKETIAAIIHCTKLPMSIIIVGVGDADFTAMDMLDADDGVLRDSAGNKAVRDIVQFVPFRQFRTAPQAELAKHVLAEVPRQVCEYFRRVNLPPCAAPQQGLPGQMQQLSVS